MLDSECRARGVPDRIFSLHCHSKIQPLAPRKGPSLCYVCFPGKTGSGGHSVSMTRLTEPDTGQAPQNLCLGESPLVSGWMPCGDAPLAQLSAHYWPPFAQWMGNGTIGPHEGRLKWA
jgi:hypothetical protein